MVLENLWHPFVVFTTIIALFWKGGEQKINCMAAQNYVADEYEWNLLFKLEL